MTERDVIRVEIDPELADIVPGYLEGRRNELAVLRAALDSSDMESLRMLGHRMKGSGGGYGFEGISEIGLHLEQAARDGDVAASTAAVDALESYLQRVVVV